MSARLQTVILAVITTVWVLNTVAGAFPKVTGYDSSATIDGIFLTIVGGAFTFYWSGKGRNGNGNGNDTKAQRGGDHRG